MFFIQCLATMLFITMLYFVYLHKRFEDERKFMQQQSDYYHDLKQEYYERQQKYEQHLKRIMQYLDDKEKYNTQQFQERINNI